MDEALIQQVISAQHASGAFPSYVVMNGQVVTDENCFVTALVSLELLKLPSSKTLKQTLDRAIAFVEACEDPNYPGAFRYYPYHLESPRLNIPIVNDLDDSALASLLLLQSGRRDAKTVYSYLENVFGKNRKHWISSADPDWITEGATWTWLTGSAYNNPVDACVNVNVAALYAQLGYWEASIFQSITDSLQRLAIFWGDPALKWRSVAPFYAHPIELLYALERAVRAGATVFRTPLAHFATYSWALADTELLRSIERPICCNAHGRPLWYAPVLQQIRHAFSQNTKMKLSYGNC